MKKVALVVACVLLAAFATYRYGPELFVESLIGNNDKPRVVYSQVGLSPDSRWEYTLEHLDNGLGFGMGAMYDEVHINRPGVRSFQHGDKDASCVFYVEATDTGGAKPIVRWIDSRHLIVEYPEVEMPGKEIPFLDDVAISYRRVPSNLKSALTMTPNQSPDPAPASGTSPAGQEPRLR